MDMKKSVQSFNWQVELNISEIDRIDNDFILLEKPVIESTFKYPFKVDTTTVILCLSGQSEGMINMEPHINKPSVLTILLPDQILHYKAMSDDFSGLFIIMSNKFTQSLDIPEAFPLFATIRDHPSITLPPRAVESMKNYFYMMQRVVRKNENPYRLETIRNLIRAFFYGAGYQFYKMPDNKSLNKQDLLVESFLKLVKTYYKQERSVKFYADKLCITPKYISSLVKESSGKSANEWIDSYVILESRALLKSTNMTIQQIADELNFPSQSFFGKYFKRILGVSPKQYRDS